MREGIGPPSVIRFCTHPPHHFPSPSSLLPLSLLLAALQAREEAEEALLRLLEDAHTRIQTELAVCLFIPYPFPPSRACSYLGLRRREQQQRGGEESHKWRDSTPHGVSPLFSNYASFLASNSFTPTHAACGRTDQK